MGYVGLVGARYLRSRKKSFISVITVIAIIGVTLGVAALAVVVSITTGFQQEFKRKVLGVNAHVLVRACRTPAAADARPATSPADWSR